MEPEDLDAAVEAGILPRENAEALRAFVARRRGSLLDIAGREDERFRFMTGFNDFFFAVGILLLGFGLLFFAGQSAVPVWPSLAAAGLMWLLSELLVRRMRLVLPGILLSIFFVFFVFWAARFDLLWAQGFFPLPRQTNPAPSNLFLGLLGFHSEPRFVALRALTIAAAATAYYWRFRLPFSLLLIAASLTLLVISITLIVTGPISALGQSLIALACGLVLFAAAVTFDISDRDRKTRRADCAFWLHALAAIVIVHSAISAITPSGNLSNNSTAIAILVIVAILALVAIIVDRRALLVSALAYLGALISYSLSGPTSSAVPNFSSVRSEVLARAADELSPGMVAFLTLTILGTFVIALGVGWIPLRRRLVAIIPRSIANKLAPTG